MRTKLEDSLRRTIKLSNLRDTKIKEVIWNYLYHQKMISSNLSELTERVLCGDFSNLNESDLNELCKILNGGIKL